MLRLRMSPLALCLYCAMSVWAAEKPPTPYIDKGACPFEGCIYREWTVTQDTKLLNRPNGHGIGMLRVGDRVTGVTGEVHSIPVLVHAIRDVIEPGASRRAVIPKGAPFYLLHYLGEGNWLAWYCGKLIAVDEFKELNAKPRATWWVKVRTVKGTIGWALAKRNFEGWDRYG